MEVSQVIGVPPKSYILDWDFSEPKPSSYGVPPRAMAAELNTLLRVEDGAGLLPQKENCSTSITTLKHVKMLKVKHGFKYFKSFFLFK